VFQFSLSSSEITVACVVGSLAVNSLATCCWFALHRCRPAFEQRPRDVVAPHVSSKLERLAVAGVWVRATRKQQLNHRQVSSVDSQDERKASARVHVRPSIHKQANNRERAVVRGDAQGSLPLHAALEQHDSCGGFRNGAPRRRAARHTGAYAVRWGGLKRVL